MSDHRESAPVPSPDDSLCEEGIAEACATGVSLRVYGAYIEARRALKGNAPAVAARVLEWLLGHLAEERGMDPSAAFSAKLRMLADRAAISRRVEESLFPKALSDTDTPERAWALMSIAEHAFYRLYLHPTASD